MSNFQKVKNKSEIILQQSETYDKSYETLPAGVYKTGDAGGMFTGVIPFFKPIDEKDEIIEFREGAMKSFIENVEKFFKKETILAYEEMKIAHKMGYLFYGKPGSGKTSLCFLAMRMLAKEYNAICLDCTGEKLSLIKYTIRKIREIQDNPIVVFYDEFDNELSYREADFLPFLDGNDSINKSIFLCCTNYIDKIPARIKDRKSRIKECFCIDCLPYEVFEQYVSQKLSSDTKENIAKFAFLAEEHKLTIDQLKNAIIDYKISGMTIEQSIQEALKITE